MGARVAAAAVAEGSRLRWPALALLVAVGAAPAPQAQAEDRLTIKGNYFRETSTRVLQPLVTFRKELPDERFALETEYLLDVITSASIAAGSIQLGGDKLFTEMRHEASLRGITQIGDWTGSAFYRYTTETDYKGHNFGFGVSRSFLRKTATVSLSYSASLDRAYSIRNNVGDLFEWTSSGDTNRLQVHYLSLGYTHILHQQVLAGVNVEGIFAAGPQDNPYRRAQNATPELHPWTRRRIAPSIWLRAAVPQAKMTLEPRYRAYADDWGIVSHAPELRVHFRPHRDLALRLRYRYYTQSEAYFWRDAQDWQDPAQFPTDDDPWVSDDPKMDDFRSHTVGLQLRWYLDGIAKFKGLGWLDGAWLEANYNHVFIRCDDPSTTCTQQDFGYGPVQSTRYGDNRHGHLAFSMAF